MKAGEPPPWAEVALSVYVLHGAKALNTVAEGIGLGGVYHVGIEVYWLEWSYGWSCRGTGVHCVSVGQSRIGKFKERLVLGRTPMPPHEVFNVLAQMRKDWPGQDYHYLRQNCGHFCAELAKLLRVPGEIPTWVTSLAETGDWIAQLFTGGGSTQDDDESSSQSGDEMVEKDNEVQRSCSLLDMLDEDPIVVKSELEWQWAQEHTFERARTVSQAYFEYQLKEGMLWESGLLNSKWAPHALSMMTGL